MKRDEEQNPNAHRPPQSQPCVHIVLGFLKWPNAYIESMLASATAMDATVHQTIP